MMGGGGEAPAGMNVEKVKSQMHSLALGEAMSAAAENYKKEMRANQRASGAGPSHQLVDIDDLLDDPELERLHAERLAALQRQVERRAVMQQKGHGEYQELSEGEFLGAVTAAPRAVVHFFHRDFERCRIMDKHLAALAPRHFSTRFLKLSAPDAPFFVDKLAVRMLPCVVLFISGVAVARVEGFESLGGKDDFPTATLEARLLAAGVVDPPPAPKADSDDEGEALRRRTMRQSSVRTGSDEDSDFSD